MFFTQARAVAPIRLGVGFAVFTFLLFLFGPWKFPFQNDSWLKLIIILYFVSLYTGFKAGLSADVHFRPRINAPRTRRLFLHLGTLAFVITAVTVVPRFMIEVGYFGGDFRELISLIQFGLEDPYAAYKMRQLRPPITGAWRVINFACVATGFVAWLYTGITILTWKHLSHFRKLFSILYWVILIAQAIAKGQNFGVFDVLLQISTFVVISRLTTAPVSVDPDGGGTRPSHRIARAPVKPVRLAPARVERSFTRSPKAFGAAVIAILAVVLFVTSFAHVMESRVGPNYTASYGEGVGTAEVDYENAQLKLLPEEAIPLALTLSSYVSHGYVGLGYARDLPFHSTFGFGASRFIMDNLEELFGVDLMSRTYPFRIEVEYGYDSHVKWHTAYLWIANDVSPYGVPFVLFCLMFIFGFAWKDFLINGNCIAVLLMGVFATFMAFLSANNHAFSESNSLTSFCVLMIAWLSTRRIFDWSEVLNGKT